MWKEALAFRNGVLSLSLVLWEYLVGISVLEEIEQIEWKGGCLAGLRSFSGQITESADNI